MRGAYVPPHLRDRGGAGQQRLLEDLAVDRIKVRAPACLTCEVKASLESSSHESIIVPKARFEERLSAGWTRQGASLQSQPYAIDRCLQLFLPVPTSGRQSAPTTWSSTMYQTMRRCAEVGGVCSRRPFPSAPLHQHAGDLQVYGVILPTGTLSEEREDFLAWFQQQADDCSTDSADSCRCNGLFSLQTYIINAMVTEPAFWPATEMNGDC